MESHGYDATGLSSSLLAVGLLIPTIATLYLVSSKQKEKTVKCGCNQCTRALKKKKIDKYRILMFSLLILLIFPIYNIIFNEYNKNILSNPYNLLEISSSATNKEIEKAYRTRIRKIRLMKKISSTEKKKNIQSIIKAKDLLLNPEAREQWDAFGDAPAVSTHTIAIPSWVMSKYNPFLLVFLYILTLVVLLPKFVSYMWMCSFEYSSSGILYKSTEALYRALKHTTTRDVIGLLVLFNKYTVELMQYKLKTPNKNIQKLKEIIVAKYGIKLSLDMPVFTISIGMLLLRDSSVYKLINKSDIEYMQSKIILCATAIKSLAIAFKNNNMYYLAFDLERCIVQSIPYSRYSLMQTGVSFEEAFISAYEKSSESTKPSLIDERMFKIHIAGIDIYNSVDGIIGRNGSITSSTDSIVKVTVFRDGTSNSLYSPVSFSVSSNKKKKGNGDLAELEVSSEEIYPSSLERHPVIIRKRSVEYAHAPTYFEDVPYTWVCTLEVNSEIIMESPEFAPSKTGSEIFFKLPPMENLTLSKKAEISTKLSNGKYFERDTSAKAVILIK